MIAPDMTMNPILVALGIFLGSVVSEDAALLAATSLASTGMLNPVLALSSAGLGICVGDLGLYGLARCLGPTISRKRWFSHRVTPEKLKRAQAFSSRWGLPALAASRFIPGSRLPMTVASGFLKMPLRRFASVSALGSALWVLTVFGAVMTLSVHTSWKVALGAVATLLFGSGFVASQWTKISVILVRWTHWEFWPAWLFYPPVAAMCLFLAARYSGLTLPTVSNLNQKFGGIIGESKAEILAQLRATSPAMVAKTCLIAPGEHTDRMRAADQAVAENGLSFPFVFKPDVGQRGAGFRIIRDWAQASDYLSRVPGPIVLQEYAEGPLEAGIFYYRLPGESQGRIFAITDKIFPVIRGDGSRTVAEIIAADPRARLIYKVYMQRLADSAGKVLPAGEFLRLVEAGNHCQGCIFQDGQHLFSAMLAEKIDQISQKLEGFYIGRYDVRYASEQDLREGRFVVIELNGASSEATSIYDSRNSLGQAYAVLYRQWELVYRIGAMNRTRGHKPGGLWQVLSEWRRYQQVAEVYPTAD